jgi:sulfite reductase beta subunit-like hemoprotein
MAARIREELAGVLPPDAAVCISGCPNGCAQHAVADFGLGGVLTTVDGVQQEAYNLIVDGGMGRNDVLARPIAQRLDPEQVIDRIASKSTQASTSR